MGNTLIGIFNNFIGKQRNVNHESQEGGGSDPEQLVYSWDRQPKKDIKLLTIQDESHMKMHRSLTTELSGQQFTIRNCSHALFTVPSFMNCLLIDDCSNCKIVLGPVKGSIYMRNCHQCLLVASCGQFRARDCSDLNLFLHCCSQPSIESSLRINFNCLSLNYDQYPDQLAMAGLEISVNLWCRVFDFTPAPQPTDDMPSKPDADRNCNWILLDIEDRLENFLSHEELIHCSNQGLCFDRNASTVPYTHPSMEKVPKPSSDISDDFFSLVPSTKV